MKIFIRTQIIPFMLLFTLSLFVGCADEKDDSQEKPKVVEVIQTGSTETPPQSDSGIKPLSELAVLTSQSGGNFVIVYYGGDSLVVSNNPEFTGEFIYRIPAGQIETRFNVNEPRFSEEFILSVVKGSDYETFVSGKTPQLASLESSSNFLKRTGGTWRPFASSPQGLASYAPVYVINETARVLTVYRGSEQTQHLFKLDRVEKLTVSLPVGENELIFRDNLANQVMQQELYVIDKSKKNTIRVSTFKTPATQMPDAKVTLINKTASHYRVYLNGEESYNANTESSALTANTSGVFEVFSGSVTLELIPLKGSASNVSQTFDVLHEATITIESQEVLVKTDAQNQAEGI
ncbi:MAG: hypothetical protein HQM12_11505 [SAR324 cluster bacterium]|nr:hypothetical protein [SAR324 cluster bacterium]